MIRCDHHVEGASLIKSDHDSGVSPNAYAAHKPDIAPDDRIY